MIICIIVSGLSFELDMNYFGNAASVCALIFMVATLLTWFDGD
jgi:hypothetical protein